MPASIFYAHSSPTSSKPDKSWQQLRPHLAEVARLAENFARETGIPSLPELAFAAGWLHDLGKYRTSFQSYIRGNHIGQKGHKQAGAVHSYDAENTPLTLAILGHHGGLPNQDEQGNQVEDEHNGRCVLEEVWQEALRDCPELGTLTIPAQFEENIEEDLFTRVLFSCLVDADWTDTGEHERKCREWEEYPKASLLNAEERLRTLLAFLKAKGVQSQQSNSRLGELRNRILDACLKGGEEQTGLFTLTVPTGGGKTFSSLAFALKHAAQHGLRRIIYVAPFISILDQNADVIRAALNISESDIWTLFEHQSLAEPFSKTDINERESSAIARRAENWDAPIVITTNVQFFQSLFANRPGPCRKVHNIARSVIILDECQSLPPDLVKPTCQMLNQLTKTLGCTVVLCTATQPTFDHEKLKEDRLLGNEIIPEDLKLFEELKRVELIWPKSREEKLTWFEVAELMLQERAALTIVNTKTAAKDLYTELKKSGQTAFHLSTSMCPAHRRGVLDTVKKLLKKGVYVVSTQLIEAGVDIDFPAVFRELAPLESIIQAAGRCNREGLLPNFGKVVVFQSVEGKLPNSLWYKKGTQIVKQLFLDNNRNPQIDNPEIIREYYRHLYWSGELDQHNISGSRNGLRFSDTAENYQLIANATVPVVVRSWKEHAGKIEELLNAVRKTPIKANFRALAPYQINLFENQLLSLSQSIVQLDERFDLRAWDGVYDAEVGLLPEAKELDLLIV